MADKLKKTVAEIRQMNNQEFLEWGIWHAREQQHRELEAMKGR